MGVDVIMGYWNVEGFRCINCDDLFVLNILHFYLLYRFVFVWGVAFWLYVFVVVLFCFVF